jgi:hypothetical protein
MPPRIYPTVAETIETHRLLIEEFGGVQGIRDAGWWSPPFCAHKPAITVTFLTKYPL